MSIQSQFKEARDNVICDITSYLESMLETCSYDDLEEKIVKKIIEKNCLEKAISQTIKKEDVLQKGESNV